MDKKISQKVQSTFSVDKESEKVEEQPPLIDPREIKRKFLLANNLEEIDESLHAYISVTTVQEIITDILAPVMLKARNESEFVKNLGIRITDSNLTLEAQSKEMITLKRSFK